MITKQQTAQAIQAIQIMDVLRKKVQGLNGDEHDAFRNSLQIMQDYIRNVEADKAAVREETPPPTPPVPPAKGDTGKPKK